MTNHGGPANQRSEARRARRGERGQTMVEFALIVPLMLVIVFGIVDFGRAYSVWVTITNAAREGARYGITNPTDTSGITSSVKKASGSYNDTHLTVSTPTCSTACTSGNSITVTANYSLSLITPVAGLVKFIVPSIKIKSTWTLTSSSTMRIE
jgi:Flp pilus assembly protein TadG